MKAPILVVMGSDSDWNTMKETTEALNEFGVDYEAQVVSAHRTPEKMIEIAKSASADGVRVIVAGAGGAAHLPGMIASLTELPVIGVPVAQGALQGQDALLSIVQMPKGVPVATVAIGGAWNAGVLAVQILAAGTGELGDGLRARLREYKKKLEAKVDSMKLPPRN